MRPVESPSRNVVVVLLYHFFTVAEQATLFPRYIKMYAYHMSQFDEDVLALPITEDCPSLKCL